MSDRADAHIHLMEGGFQTASLSQRPGIKVDEPVFFASLMETYGVKKVLVVGYADEPWCADNTRYLAEQVKLHDWINPTAFLLPQDVNVAALEALEPQGFVGISQYIFGDERVAALKAIGDDAWQFITDRNWLVSVNSRGDDWNAWQTILDKHGDLRVCISHLGLPPRVAEPPRPEVAAARMQTVTHLAQYPQVRVKLSGFYALSDPGHDFPHRAAWPYVEQLVEAFGTDRLLWASDFAPSTEDLSYPQTFDLFRHMPFLSDADRAAIEGGNLLKLLDEVKR